ncbi:MAG: SDR family NAD(P)-dependent oxidoreductase [Gemmatimonadaceae bacterium]
MPDAPRVAVLTGIGKTGQTGEIIARVLAARGLQLAVVDRTPAGATSRANELRATGISAQGFGCDLTDDAQVAVLARDIAHAFGPRVDALINVAGGFGMTGPVADSTTSSWFTQFAINLTTAYLSTRAFLPALRAARGAIVYFASAAALPSARVANISAYAAAKSGVVALMRAVADEERTYGVRANAVAPTSIRTATNVQAMGGTGPYVEREDVAATVAWLCSDDAKAITGQVIRIG